MNPGQLLTHFDRISEAPDAIPRLRRFILDLAVRGKLVEQDPRDEPASELLRRIQVEKSRLVSVGEIKKEKPLPTIEEDELPFAIPASWWWVRLNDITSYIQRGKSPKYAIGDGLPVISQKCVQWAGLDLQSAKLVTLKSIEEYENIRFVRSGDLLWNSTGTGTIGRIIRVTEPPVKLVCDSHVTVVRCLKVDPEYVRSWLSSDHVYALIEERAAGSTNQVELTSQMAKNQVVPLPPLAEQQRIVTKVDELMALGDRLEAAQAERDGRRDRLAVAVHTTVSNSSFPIPHSTFFINHLPRLTTKHEHIQQLRQTILNLAVRGQLVSQDPNDEPASELFKRIEAEKAWLMKEEKIKTGKPLPEIDEPSTLFDLPNGWAWARLGRLSQLVTSGSRDWAKFYSGDGAIFVRMGNLSRCSYQLRLGNVQRVKAPVDSEGERTKVEEGDILISITGEVGLLGLVPPNFGEAYINQHTCLVRPMSQLRNRYLPEFFRSPFAQNQFNEPQRGIKNSFRLTDVTHLVVPLPPVTEQHRIVAKVDELMALCDRLEAQLTTSQTEGRRLLEAVLHEALVPVA